MSGPAEREILSILNQLQNSVSNERVAVHSSISTPPALSGSQTSGITMHEMRLQAAAAALNPYQVPSVAPGTGYYQAGAIGSRLPGIFAFAPSRADQQISTSPVDLLQRTQNVILLTQMQQGTQCLTREIPVREMPTHVLMNSSTLLGAAPYLEVPSANNVGGSGNELHRLLSQITRRDNETNQSYQIPMLNDQSHTWRAALLSSMSLPVAEQIDAGVALLIRLRSAPIPTNAHNSGVTSRTSHLPPSETRVQPSQPFFPISASSTAALSFGRSDVGPTGSNQLHVASAARQNIDPLPGNCNSNNPSTAAQSAVTNRGNETAGSRKKRKYPHANFSHKLHQIVTKLEEEGKDDIATFMDEGGIWVRNKDTFVNEIMPLYCRGQGWSSFRRQLFSYRFSALPPSKGKNGAYANSLFLRGRPELCDKIIRDDKHDKVNRRSRHG
ncbi:hypothetical protein ACA910_019413 [Epithemia clementina (nom. ined.)]